MSSKNRKPWLQIAKIQSRGDKYSRTSNNDLVFHQLPTAMDVTFKHPTNIQVCGPTFCGKSYWTEKLLQHADEMFNEKIENIIYCYGEFQPQLIEMQNQIYRTFNSLKDFRIIFIRSSIRNQGYWS
jgi:hypothetical protein